MTTDIHDIFVNNDGLTEDERIARFHADQAKHAAAGCGNGYGKSSWLWIGGQMTDKAICNTCGKELTPRTPKQTKYQ